MTDYEIIYSADIVPNTLDTVTITVSNLNSINYSEFTDFYHFEGFITDLTRTIIRKVRTMSPKTFQENCKTWDPAHGELTQFGFFLYGEF